ncbi:MAG: glycosyltransferase family 4 protein [Planctomycetota bacterium]
MHVLHVLDASCDETQLQLMDSLRSRPARDGGGHTVCSIDGPMTGRAARFLCCDVLHAERRLWRAMNVAPLLSTCAPKTGATLVHAWGVAAAAACSARLPDLPLVLTVVNPEVTRDAGRWVRSFPTDATVVAGNQATAARLLAAGVVPERVVVIRGPVDFGAINDARAKDIRRSVVGDAEPVLLMPGPPSASSGAYYGVWASAVLLQVFTDLRVIMPYDSTESRRLQRFVRDIRMPSMLVVPDPRLTWPQLVSCADVMMAPARGDICTEPIAMAMAAGVTVVGAAVRSVAELITDRRTGLLYDPRRPRLLANRVLEAIDDPELRRTLGEAARARAFEMFSARAFLDNYQRLYENILSGKPPGAGVRDTFAAA